MTERHQTTRRLEWADFARGQHRGFAQMLLVRRARRTETTRTPSSRGYCSSSKVDTARRRGPTADWPALQCDRLRPAERLRDPFRTGPDRNSINIVAPGAKL